jgi:hypothetical protein
MSVWGSPPAESRAATRPSEGYARSVEARGEGDGNRRIQVVSLAAALSTLQTGKEVRMFGFLLVIGIIFVIVFLVGLFIRFVALPILVVLLIIGVILVIVGLVQQGLLA